MITQILHAYTEETTRRVDFFLIAKPFHIALLLEGDFSRLIGNECKGIRHFTTSSNHNNATILHNFFINCVMLSPR